eukprot:672018-Amphidinium_carterae.1
MSAKRTSSEMMLGLPAPARSIWRNSACRLNSEPKDRARGPSAPQMGQSNGSGLVCQLEPSNPKAKPCAPAARIRVLRT